MNTVNLKGQEWATENYNAITFRKIKSCESLGEFWRLPTIEEWAAILQSNRYLIGVHEKYELLPNVYPPPPRDYWSSTHNLESINYWSFSYGTQVSRNHTSKNFVRAVRSI